MRRGAREACQGSGLWISSESFKVEVRLALELVCAVAGADSYSQGVDAGFCYEFSSLLRVGERCVSGIYLDVVFYAGELTRARLLRTTPLL